MASVEIAGVTVEIDSEDEAVVGVVATMLAEAAAEHGPCVLTPECNQDTDLLVVGDPPVRVFLG